MRKSSTIAAAGCLLTVFGMVGCRHSAGERQHASVSEPAGMIVIREHPNGTPGTYVAVDKDGSTPLAPGKGETRTAAVPPASVKPVALPAKITAKPLPAENILEPVAPASKVSPSGTIPLSKSEESKASPIKLAGAINAVTKVPPTSPYGAKMPEMITPAQALVVRPNTTAGPDFTKGNIPSLAANPKAGHAADYGWVVGELCFSHANKNWRVRYAGLDMDDRYGGSITLSGADQMLERMVSGQLVRVEGEVLEKNRSSAPRYHVVAMTPVE